MLSPREYLRPGVAPAIAITARMNNGSSNRRLDTIFVWKDAFRHGKDMLRVFRLCARSVTKSAIQHKVKPSRCAMTGMNNNFHKFRGYLLSMLEKLSSVLARNP